MTFICGRTRAKWQSEKAKHLVDQPSQYIRRLPSTARFEQVVSHVKKPGKLLSIDATVLVQLRDELKQAIDESSYIGSCY